MDKTNCLAPLGTYACRIKELGQGGVGGEKHLPPGLGMRFQTPVWIISSITHGKKSMHGLGPKLIIGAMSVNTAVCPPLQIHTHSYLLVKYLYPVRVWTGGSHSPQSTSQATALQASQVSSGGGQVPG